MTIVEGLPPALRARLAANPFVLLGLSPRASRSEVERAARTMLDRLALGLEPTAPPFAWLAPIPRDAEAIRAARHRLRCPQSRAEDELWWWVVQRLHDADGPRADTRPPARPA